MMPAKHGWQKCLSRVLCSHLWLGLCVGGLSVGAFNLNDRVIECGRGCNSDSDWDLDEPPLLNNATVNGSDLGMLGDDDDMGAAQADSNIEDISLWLASLQNQNNVVFSDLEILDALSDLFRDNPPARIAILGYIRLYTIMPTQQVAQRGIVFCENGLMLDALDEALINMLHALKVFFERYSLGSACCVQ